MRITYDKKADTMALVINPGGGVAKDVEIAPNVFIGYDKDGSVTEIQILDVSEMERPWLNLQAAAAMLGVSDRTLQRRIDDLPDNERPQKVGREYQLSPDEVERLARAK